MNDKIAVLDIVEDTTVDGPGFRTAIYAAGCIHACPACHNPQSWDIRKGTYFTIDEILKRIKAAEFSNVTFTGGDPLMQVGVFTQLAKRIHAETSKTIWCYTGYLYEQVVSSARLSQILPFIDVLVDGPFIDVLKDESLHFAGSSNQRVIDITESLKVGYAVKWERKFALNLGAYTQAV